MTNALPVDGSHLDIVALIETDHRTVRALLTQIASAPTGERADLWSRLMRTLVTHEVAEELVVFPAVRSVHRELDATLDERLHEQAEAEQALKRMESMDPSSDEFVACVGRLTGAVLAHAEAEERDVLPALGASEPALDRVSLGVRYENAKRKAPTHPHPSAPDRPPGNTVVGPVTSLLDRLRDHLP